MTTIHRLRALILLLTSALAGCSGNSASHLAALPFSRDEVDVMQNFVPAHNAVRARHGLSPLAWSPSLAQYARQWAEQLRRTNNCRMRHRPDSGRFAQQYGENLFWVDPKRWSDGRVEQHRFTPAMVTNAWAAEERHYRHRSNRCRRGKICGHYTQIVWRDTSEIGCARVACRDQSQLWVCNYNPPGNWRGERPY
jgi:pathogenesis-related protein 1